MGIIRHQTRAVIFPHHITETKRINQIICPHAIGNTRRPIPQRIIDILKRPIRRHRLRQAILRIVGIGKRLRPIHYLCQIAIEIIGIDPRTHLRILIQRIRRIGLRHPIFNGSNPIPRRIIDILQILICNAGICRN